MTNQTTPVDRRYDLGRLPSETLLGWLRTMVLIREFEEACEPLGTDGSIPGGAHLAVGQEGVAVGTAAALEPQDVMTASHRPHHHALAKGIGPREAMAELYGRATGCVGGRGGSMHLSDHRVGFLGGNGIVGAGLGIAMGAGLAARMQRADRVAVGFFGDGAVNTGRTWEALNMAGAWRAQLIAICENNLYAVETPLSRVMAGGSIVERARGFGLRAVLVDGQDVGAVYEAVEDARARAVAGEGPTFIEAQTYRYHGHNIGEVVTYRTDDEVQAWRESRDPIEHLRGHLVARGALDESGWTALREDVLTTVADAIAFADASPWPDPETAILSAATADGGDA